MRMSAGSLAFSSSSAVGDLLGQQPRVGARLLGDGEHHGRRAVDGRIAASDLRRLDHAGHLAQEHGPLAVGLDHHVLDVLDALEPPDRADQVLAGAAVQIAARGVGVAGGHRLLDLVQRHAVVAQRVGIDQHLKLLASAAHRDDLGDARDRQAAAAARPNRPACGLPSASSCPLRSTCRRS